jgi:hypothetical protein
MDRFFQVLAGVLAGVAAYFLWNGEGDRGFVSAVAGAVSFFLSIRVQVKRRNDAREAERLAAEKAANELAEDEEFDSVDTADSEPSTADKS